MGAYGIIYLLIDGTNDMEYVGQTTRTLKYRFYQHKYGNQYVDRMIQNHGDLFLKIILKACYSRKELDYWEKHFIKSRNTMFPNGYNFTEGGEGSKHCNATRARLSAINTGKQRTEEMRLNISMKKRTISPYKNLIAEMDKRRFSYVALAKLLGLSVVTFSDKMRGKSNFTLKAVARLVEIFDLPAKYLLKRNDGISPITSESERGKKISARVRRKSPFKNLLNEMGKRNFLYDTLAKLLELSKGTLSEKMQSKVKFTDKDIAKLVEIFGKSAEYLLERDDDKKLLKAKHYETPYKNLIGEINKNNLTYTALAELLDLSRPVFSNKMLGKRKFNSKDIAKLVEIFGKPAEYLMQRDED